MPSSELAMKLIVTMLLAVAAIGHQPLARDRHMVANLKAQVQNLRGSVRPAPAALLSLFGDSEDAEDLPPVEQPEVSPPVQPEVPQPGATGDAQTAMNYIPPQPAVKLAAAIEADLAAALGKLIQQGDSINVAALNGLFDDANKHMGITDGQLQADIARLDNEEKQSTAREAALNSDISGLDEEIAVHGEKLKGQQGKITQINEETKGKIATINADTKEKIATINAETKRMETEIAGKIANINADTKEKIATIDAETKEMEMKIANMHKLIGNKSKELKALSTERGKRNIATTKFRNHQLDLKKLKGEMETKEAQLKKFIKKFNTDGDKATLTLNEVVAEMQLLGIITEDTVRGQALATQAFKNILDQSGEWENDGTMSKDKFKTAFEKIVEDSTKPYKEQLEAMIQSHDASNAHVEKALKDLFGSAKEPYVKKEKVKGHANAWTFLQKQFMDSEVAMPPMPPPEMPPMPPPMPPGEMPPPMPGMPPMPKVDAGSGPGTESMGMPPVTEMPPPAPAGDAAS